MTASRMFSPVVVFALCVVASIAARPAQAQKFEVLHTFHGKDGAFPSSQLVRDAAGNFYGTAEKGGAGDKKCDTDNLGCGTAFKLDKTGRLVWVHSFNGPNGSVPSTGLLQGQDGEFYGTTTSGGDIDGCGGLGCGTVFKLDKNGGETLLYKFKGHPGDGWSPESLLIEDSAGNLYGTTTMGGESDLGIVFKLDTKGKKTILYNFKGPIGGGEDGAYPGAGVIRDAAGNLYGGTGAGGDDGKGTVFEVDTNGNETILYSFTGGLDGAGDIAVLLMDSAGNLYGTSGAGGYYGCGYDCGSVYELSRIMGGWKEITLYTFCSLEHCEDGEQPLFGPLVRDKHGNLYGTTESGGTVQCNSNGTGCGVVFKLDSDGKESVLHNFSGGADGDDPAAGLIMDESGNLYGTTNRGGDLNCQPKYGGCGVVFKITP